MPPPRAALRLSRWLTPFALLGLAAAVAFVGLYLLDWFIWHPAGAKPGPAAQSDADLAQRLDQAISCSVSC